MIENFNNSNTAIAETISNLVPSQLSGYVRENYPNFVLFLQAYYQFMEQYNASNIANGNGAVTESISNFLDYLDIDTTIDRFRDHLYDEYLKYFPRNFVANPALVAKNAQQYLYKQKGTPASFRFLFRALYGANVEIFTPKKNILIASAGKWFVQQSLLLSTIVVNGVATNSLDGLSYFTNTEITGSSSNAKAHVERVLVSLRNGVTVYELFVSSVRGSFTNGETITATDIDGNVLSAILVSGQVSRVVINTGGSRYNVGDPLVFSSAPAGGNTAAGYVSNVSQGTISSFLVTKIGAGFKVNDAITFSGGGSAQNSNAYISVLDGTANNYWHPNTYNINSDVISNFLNVTLNANTYGFATANVNILSTIANSWSTFAYGPCGPIRTVTIVVSANDYVSAPIADVVSNTRVKTLGVIGRIDVVNGGTGYNVNDQLIFTNVTGGYGSGANGRVANVAANGAITRCELVGAPGYLPGGAGYDINYMPRVTVNSANGTGANLIASSLLAWGYPSSNIIAGTSNIGTILDIVITSPGSFYNTAPTINMASSGDGTANLTANIVTGVYTYAGRFLDDTGFVSSASNYLQDADYYQNYAYVLKVQQCFDDYVDIVKRLLHPAGMKMWGEYTMEETNVSVAISTTSESNNSTETIYTANAVKSLVNVGSYLVRNTALTGVSNSVVGTLSLWFNMRTAPSANSSNATLFYIGNNAPTGASLLVKLCANPVSNAANVFIEVVGKDANGATILRIASNTQDVITASNTWVHLLTAWDTTNSNAMIYLSNVKSSNVVTLTNGQIALNVNATSVFAKANGIEFFAGDLSEIWFTNTYIDISNVTNRQKFVSSSLKPVSLGPTGNTPTGSSALVYLKGNANTINVNAGTGGNYNIANTLLVSNTSPSDL